MTLTLTVDEPAWRHHVQGMFERLGPRLIPVVKGNGYGLGRRILAELSIDLGRAHSTSADVSVGVRMGVGVGTVYELADLGDVAANELIVLTPTLDEHLDGLPSQTVLTVGSRPQIRHLVDCEWSGAVVVKVASSMLRHGLTPGELASHCDLLSHLNVIAYAIHPPLAGTSGDHRAEIAALVGELPPGEVQISHVAVDDFEGLVAGHPERTWRLRLGTALWHGDRSWLQLSTVVLDVRPVSSGQPVGYRLVEAPGDGHLVIVGAGSVHGVVPLPDGRSPFHFARRRLAMIEPPHMHVAMLHVPTGDPCPEVGDVVDVQRPLISVDPDQVVWAS